jgi:hypothetical protein
MKPTNDHLCKCGFQAKRHCPYLSLNPQAALVKSHEQAGREFDPTSSAQDNIVCG